MRKKMAVATSYIPPRVRSSHNIIRMPLTLARASHDNNNNNNRRRRARRVQCIYYYRRILSRPSIAAATERIRHGTTAARRRPRPPPANPDKLGVSAGRAGAQPADAATDAAADYRW